ncbi:hypothetical protein EVAR_79386_1 [Eumeta japonica]|uniref:Uncharacterized protein n=1 Tax=Eumeta variegata TaxID=151549 RepID=A0A4C1VHN9_EUMVA|nr:hypothetical protein EVAR_79386_1 [Eumeta japonica]
MLYQTERKSALPGGRAPRAAQNARAHELEFCVALGLRVIDTSQEIASACVHCFAGTLHIIIQEASELIARAGRPARADPPIFDSTPSPPKSVYPRPSPSLSIRRTDPA